MGEARNVPSDAVIGPTGNFLAGDLGVPPGDLDPPTNGSLLNDLLQDCLRLCLGRLSSTTVKGD